MKEHEEFANRFEHLKYVIHRGDDPILSLEHAQLLWNMLKEKMADSRYESYFHEYWAVVRPLLSPELLAEYDPDRLSELLDIVAHFQGHSEYREIQRARAKQLFYAGAYDSALQSVCTLVAIDHVDAPAEVELAGLDELATLKVLVEQYKNIPALHTVLSELVEEWEAERGQLWPDRIRCLFYLDTDHILARGVKPGHMLTLAGSVEPGGANTPDEVTFDNQIKAPDDLFVGAVYAALKAVRKVLGGLGLLGGQTGKGWRARLNIEGATYPFTGDSIGLAAALLAYAQLLKARVLRHERFISSDVAVTGRIDEEGNIKSVGERTLLFKLTRALYSPVKYVVIPEEQLADARKIMATWNESYPHRRLHVIGHRHLSEVVADRNIMRSEKLCLGEFLARRAYKYSRATKIQIPLLILLSYLTLCLVNPTYWLFFDRQPEYVQLTETGFEALNADSATIWSKSFAPTQIREGTRHVIGDIDLDGRNEVLFAPNVTDASNRSLDATLLVYDDDGDTLFTRRCPVFGEYPGDEDSAKPYPSALPRILSEREGTPLIATVVTESIPSRAHIRLWSAQGDSLGWFINAGAVSVDPDRFSDYLPGVIVFAGTNNRYGKACFGVLPTDSLRGVSPPYSDDYYNLESVTRGNQRQYILFPQSDLSAFYENIYNGVEKITAESDTTLRVEVNENAHAEPPPLMFYHLDIRNGFRAISVTAEDIYKRERRQKIKSGMIPDVPLQQYLDSLLSEVAYWRDGRLVTERELRNTDSITTALADPS